MEVNEGRKKKKLNPTDGERKDGLYMNKKERNIKKNWLINKK